MNREFLFNIFLLLGINLLIKPVYLFAIDAQIQYLAGPESYGVYFALFNFAFLFQIVNDFGIQNYTSSSIAADSNFINHDLGNVFGVKIVLSVLFIATALVSGYLIGYPAQYYYLLLLICINQILSTLFMLLRCCIAAIGRYRVDSLLSGLDKLLMIIILGYLLYGKGPIQTFAVVKLVYTQMFALGVSCLVGAIILSSSVETFSIKWSWNHTIKLLQKTAPYALVLVLMVLYTRVDSVMLERLLPETGKEAAGIYASCYRYLEALSMIGYLFASLLLPMYSKSLAEDKSLDSLSNVALRVLTVVSMSAAIAFIVYRRELLLWRYPDANEVYFDTLALLMVSFVCVSLSYIYGTMHVAKGQLASINKVFAAGVVLSIVLNMLMIPKYGVIGAAATTVVTQSMVMVGQYVISKKQFNLQIDWSLIAIVTLWVGIVYASMASIQAYYPGLWYIGMGLSILCAGIAALLMRIIRVDMLLSLVSKS